ncbi:MAG: hypothetical protein DWP97_08375 [Calditrichaeota bacterium]|nr:MAG: hypothetical protein DWP97_08375 [Calditrichota bacterium]
MYQQKTSHRSIRQSLTALLYALCLLVIIIPTIDASEDAAPKYSYDDWELPEDCGSCHNYIYSQWRQSMMSQSYTHHWDEIEYFKLALPHAEKDEVVAEVKAGCNGCHSPMAFLTGDIPPAPVAENTRANDGVHCDFCHTITGHTGDIPFNFNYTIEPGETKQGIRQLTDEAPHQSVKTKFLGSAEFCGICHNEKDPYGVWVKSTHLEWKESPYAEQGVVCQDCHMTKAKSEIVDGGTVYDDARQHLFHGAHDRSKVRGTVELRIYPDKTEVKKGETVKFTVALFNQKAGHKFPTGSVEDRILWLHVEAKDASGNSYHLPVDKKGFDGEEYTIGADVLAYTDMAIPLDDPDFKGVQRDGIPIGDRIFRMAYFDPNGVMTIQQWNTKSLGVDYRIGPKETKLETFTFTVPEDAEAGELNITADLNYQLLVKPVAEFLGVPAEEADVIEVNNQSVSINVM